MTFFLLMATFFLLVDEGVLFVDIDVIFVDDYVLFMDCVTEESSKICGIRNDLSGLDCTTVKLQDCIK